MTSFSKLAFEVSRMRMGRIQLLAELGVFSGSSAKSIFVRSLPLRTLVFHLPVEGQQLTVLQGRSNLQVLVQLGIA